MHAWGDDISPAVLVDQVLSFVFVSETNWLALVDHVGRVGFRELNVNFEIWKKAEVELVPLENIHVFLYHLLGLGCLVTLEMACDEATE